MNFRFTTLSVAIATLSAASFAGCKGSKGSHKEVSEEEAARMGLKEGMSDVTTNANAEAVAGSSSNPAVGKH